MNNHILFVGSLAWYKGVHFLIEALPIIVDQFPDTHLYLVGSGPLDLSLKARVKVLRIDQIVTFIGKVPAHRIARYYLDTNVCVIPSMFETFSMVACEAMYFEIPIVAGRRGSLPELVKEGVTGFLVEPTRPEEIAIALLKLLSDPEKARQMGKKGSERVRHLYSVENYINNLERHIQTLYYQHR